MSDDELAAVRAENAALRAETAELRRLLEKIQWGGLTPPLSHGACPECSGSIDRGHRPGCAVAAALALPGT